MFRFLFRFSCRAGNEVDCGLGEGEAAGFGIGLGEGESAVFGLDLPIEEDEAPGKTGETPLSDGLGFHLVGCEV